MANELQTKLDAILTDKNTNLLPENLKAGITCLGVEGNLESGSVEGVKLFKTVEEMQADTTAKEGDLAVVYRSDIQNAVADSKFQTAIFPATVVLPTAMTGSVNITYRAVDNSVIFDCMGGLTASRFSMDCWSDTGSIRIEYTSTDGITYTRTDGGEETVNFGTEIYYAYTEMWNDAIGYFIQIGGIAFDGIYEYSSATNYRLAPTQFTTIPEHVFGSEFYGANGVEKGTLQKSEGLTREELLYKATVYSSLHKLTLDTSVTNLDSAFAYFTGETVPNIDTSNVTTMQRMFSGASNLVEVPLLNTEKVTTMQGMFSNCPNLKEVPELNTSNVTDMSTMFTNTGIETIPLFDTKQVTTMRVMFSNCKKLVRVPLMDTSNVTDMLQMFYNCTNLTEVPNFETSNVTSMHEMFCGCTSLVNVPLYDTSVNSILYNSFKDCPNLSNESLNNILAMCANSVVTSTKTLAYVGLTEEQATKCTTLSNYEALIAAGWTTGY